MKEEFNMQNFPKYDFRGYRLLKANLSRVKDKQITSFSLFSQKGVYNEENHIYELITEVTVTFTDEVNVFVFSSGYKINDLEWLEVMAEQTVINELFSVVFPFIRSKIFEFTGNACSSLSAAYKPEMPLPNTIAE